MGEPLDVTSLEPGTVLLDKYRVVETLGIGGMGAVVSADHVTLGTRVALKFLLPKLMSNVNVAERFMREARAATRIDSDHVCKVIDVDTLPDGPPFMVMEYLQGEDLAFLVDSGREFAIDEAIELIVQAAEALAKAHRKGIVHRDIKPANLFVAERGEGPPVVKVLDFGISKIVDDADWTQQAALTKTTTVLGSGLYMSPEQMRSAKNVDLRTDIYALGVCLYELLTHTQPYTADSFADLCVKVSTEPPDPLRRHRPDVPEQLAEVIARAYAARPEDRYQSIAEFVEALAPHASQHTQTAIDAIIALGDGERHTSPSLAPQPIRKTDEGGRPARHGQTTAESAALATTAAAPVLGRSRVGWVVAAAALVLAAVVGVFAIIALRHGATPATETGTPAGAETTAAPAATGTSSEELTTSEEPDTSTDDSADEDAGAEDTEPDAAASASAEPTATRKRPRPRPRPKGPRIIREGAFCFKVYPDKGGYREMVDCP